MLRVFIVFIYLVICPFSNAIEYDQYPSYLSANEFLQSTYKKNTDITILHSIGKSHSGREIYSLSITRDKTFSKEAILISAAQHGNEKPSTLAALKLVEYILQNKNDGNIAALLEKFDIHVIPISNPDGFVSTSRHTEENIDINRDFSFPERDESDSFKSIESQNLKNFADTLKVKAAIALHSGMTGVLWPWAYSSKPSKNLNTFYQISKNAADAMGINLYKQSNADYPTDGEFIDYMYMTQKSFAVTFGISDDHMPDTAKLLPIVNRSLIGMMTYMFNILDYSENIVIENEKISLNEFSTTSH